MIIKNEIRCPLFTFNLSKIKGLFMDSKLAQLFILVRLKKFKTSAKYKTKLLSTIKDACEKDVENGLKKNFI